MRQKPGLPKPAVEAQQDCRDGEQAGNHRYQGPFPRRAVEESQRHAAVSRSVAATSSVAVLSSKKRGLISLQRARR